MVIRRNHRTGRQRGAFMTDVTVATALLVVALLPIAYSFASEKRLAMAYYQRAIAMEIVDGEIEALAAGGWRTFTPGTHEYTVHAGAATNLPPGKFLLTVETHKVQLAWQPAIKHYGGAVVREATVTQDPIAK
jgi:hypothetical protein